MTGFGVFATIVLAWAWFEPEAVGKWLVKVQTGMAQYRASLNKKEEK